MLTLKRTLSKRKLLQPRKIKTYFSASKTSCRNKNSSKLIITNICTKDFLKEDSYYLHYSYDNVKPNRHLLALGENPPP
jgi:hypothetical protein